MTQDTNNQEWWEAEFDRNNQISTRSVSHGESGEYCPAWSEGQECCLEQPWIKGFIRKVSQQSREDALKEMSPARMFVHFFDQCIAGGQSADTAESSAKVLLTTWLDLLPKEHNQ